MQDAPAPIIAIECVRRINIAFQKDYLVHRECSRSQHGN